MRDALIIAAAIGTCAVMPFAIHFATKVARKAICEAKAVWSEATNFERILIVALLMVPLPGPLDEIGAALVIARVRRRTTA